MSAKLTPAAATSTRSCPGPGTGASCSASLRTSGPPCFSAITARMYLSSRSDSVAEVETGNGCIQKSAHCPRAMSDPAAEFEAQRTRLFGLAYRLLGSASDAEDVVQDAFLRWSGADRDSVAAPS